MSGGAGGEGGGFGIRGAMQVSPAPAHGGQGFLFPLLVVTLSLSFLMETIKEELPHALHDSLNQFAYPPCPQKADTCIPSLASWEPLPFTSK